MKKLLLFVAIGFILTSCNPPSFEKDVTVLSNIVIQKELTQNKIDSIQILIDSVKAEMLDYGEFSYLELQVYLPSDTLKANNLLRLYNKKELIQQKQNYYTNIWHQLDDRYEKYYQRISFKYRSGVHRDLADIANRRAVKALNLY
jgi:hypothetical protein